MASSSGARAAWNAGWCPLIPCGWKRYPENRGGAPGVARADASSCQSRARRFGSAAGFAKRECRSGDRHGRLCIAGGLYRGENSGRARGDPRVKCGTGFGKPADFQVCGPDRCWFRGDAAHLRAAKRSDGNSGAARASQAIPGIPNFVVLGGSEGSPLLNTEAPRLFSELRRRGLRFTVRHLTGFGDPAEVERIYANAGMEALVEGFLDDMRPVYANATFAIAAAGALTLAELSACGIPCLLVPTPGTARDHQMLNAQYYAERTGALTVPAGPWDTAILASRIEVVLQSAAVLKTAGLLGNPRTHGRGLSIRRSPPRWNWFGSAKSCWSASNLQV